MKLDIKQNTKHVFNSSKSLTSLLLAIAGFLLFWFLLSGSMTDNRFGFHIVWSSDLRSTPLWYGLTILWMSIFLMVGAAIMFSMLYRDKLHLTEGQEKIIRIGSLYIIGFSVFFVALSAISFAAFNTQFFNSVIWGNFKFTSMMGNGNEGVARINVADQSIAIGSLSIIAGIIIVAVGLFFFILKKEMNMKLYFTLRNGALTLTAISWFVIVLNIMAFGALGGDAGVLINGITGKNINWSDIDSYKEPVKNLLNKFSVWGKKADSKDAFIYLFNNISGYIGMGNTPGWLAWSGASGINWNFQTWWGELWTIGTTSFFPGTLNLPEIHLGMPLKDLVESIGNNKDNVNVALSLLSNLSKPGIMLGVNNSANSYLIFSLLLGCSIGIIPYSLSSYYLYEDNSLSMTYDSSIYTIIGTTMLYGLFAWILAYIPVGTWDESNADIYWHALFDKEYPSLNPGLIAGGGVSGGISQAIIYYFPYYSGTIMWDIGLALVIILPIISITTAVLLHRENIKKNLAHHNTQKDKTK